MDRKKCQGFLQVCIEVDFSSQYPWSWFDKREVDELKALQFEFMQMVDQVDDQTWRSICDHWGRPFLEVLNEAAPIQPSAHMFPLGPPPPYSEVLGLLNERMNFRPNLQFHNQTVVAQNQLVFAGMPNDGIQHPIVDIQQPNIDFQHPLMANQHPNVSVQKPDIAFQQHNVAIQQLNVATQQPGFVFQQPIAIQQPGIAFQQPNFGIPHPAMNAVQNMNSNINNTYPQPDPPAPVPMANNHPQDQFIVQPLPEPQPVMAPSPCRSCYRHRSSRRPSEACFAVQRVPPAPYLADWG